MPHAENSDVAPRRGRSALACAICCLAVALAAPRSVGRDDQIAAEELLRRWQRATELTRSSTFLSEQKLALPRTESGRQQTRHNVARVWRDGSGRYKSVRTQRSGDADATIERPPQHANTLTTLLNPRGDPYQAYALLQSVRRGKPWTQLQVFTDLSLFEGLPFTECAILDGYAESGREAIASTLLEHGELTTAPAQEAVDGRPCYVVRATSPYGVMTLWFDPARDYGLVRAEVLKRKGDLLGGTTALPTVMLFATDNEPEQRSAVGAETIVDSVTFAKVDGKWIADGTRVRDTYTFEDGRTQTYETLWKRTEIELDPDFDAKHAFEIEIPDGIPVAFSGSGGVRHVWRGGKPVPFIEPESLRALDKAVDSVSASPTTRPQGGRTTQPSQ